MSDAHPKGWTVTPLETIAAKTSYPIGDGDHGQIKPACYTNKGVPYIRVADMGWGQLTPNGLVHIPDSVHKQNLKSELVPGDVLIAKTGATIGKCCIIPDSIPRANTTASVGKVTVNREATLPKWILYYFLTREFKDQMWAVSEKTAQPGFNIRDLKRFNIPLAPLLEQCRIVAKLEELLGKVSSSQQRLARIPALLKRFRQSVLAAACSGKLTADWRNEDSEANNEHVMNDELGSLVKASELPSSWNAIPLDDLRERSRPVSYGVLKPGEYAKDGIVLLRIVDILDGVANVEKAHRIPFTLSSQYKRTLLQGGEILISLVGTIGRVASVPKSLAGANIHRNLGMIAPGTRVIGQYLLFAMQSELFQSQIRFVTTGANQPLFNLGDLKRLLVPLPPLPEQEEIVRRIEQLFTFADKIEARFTKAQAQVERLTQSVLAKAFRGELVPTEAELARRENRSYEPASELLVRIALTQLAPSGGSKRKTKRVAAKKARNE